MLQLLPALKILEECQLVVFVVEKGEVVVYLGVDVVVDVEADKVVLTDVLPCILPYSQQHQCVLFLCNLYMVFNTMVHGFIQLIVFSNVFFSHTNLDCIYQNASTHTCQNTVSPQYT